MNTPHPTRRRTCGLLVSLASLSCGAAEGTPSGVRTIHYPRSLRGLEDERQYVVALMDQALTEAGMAHRLVPSRWPMVQTRALRELTERTGTLQVAWTMTTPEREAELLPIRIPLYKGLYGWRVMLVPKRHPDRLVGVHTLDDLHKLPLVQGDDWPDTALLRANGVTVHTARNFEQMVKLLEHGPAQAFPRSVAEVTWDQQRFADRCVIDPHIVLRYPTAIYAFVRRDDPELAEALTMGLNRMVAKGSMDRLFQQHVAPLLAPLNLSRRRVIELRNPLLPASAPINRRELWWRP
jgi:hypothetical protein